MIYQLAEKWHKTLSEVYQTLNKTRILDDYIIKYLDVLHTQGELALGEDITCQAECHNAISNPKVYAGF